jgi:predicted hydrocarbon binding protein
MAHAIGKSDARAFHAKTNVKDALQKLSTGPLHFAHTGWAFVDIHKESIPSQDENFYLIYDHKNSFEADSWIAKGVKTNFCTCFMNAGYSSGWCEASFDIKLTSREISCRSRGDKQCRFIMAQPHRIEEFIHAYRKNNPNG